jgi:hypothetical protein
MAKVIEYTRFWMRLSRIRREGVNLEYCTSILFLVYILFDWILSSIYGLNYLLLFLQVAFDVVLFIYFVLRNLVGYVYTKKTLLKYDVIWRIHMYSFVFILIYSILFIHNNYIAINLRKATMILNLKS